MPPPDPSPADPDPLGQTTVVPGGVRALTPADIPPITGSRADWGIPGFELISRLADGGMGVVFHARQTDTGREVALKLLPELAAAGSREAARFLAEAQAVAAVQHPNVVEVYGSGEYEGRPYLVLEYLAGGTLADRLRARRPMPPADAARLVEAVARGVAAAHDLGIVHRDLKPANVLFQIEDSRLKIDLGQSALGSSHSPISNLQSSVPKVSDFGLAKRAGADDLTRTGTVLGTPAYMAPEQARGGTKFIGPQADVWSLGVILYECLTGTRPFPGDTLDSILYRVIHADPPPLRSAAPDIPRALERICRKCLEKDPADRYATAHELADDLARFLRGETVTARGPSMGGRLVKWAKRDPNRVLAYSLTVAVVVLIAVGTTIAVLWQRAEGAKASAETARDELTEKRDELEKTNSRLTETSQSLATQKQAVEAARDALARESAELAKTNAKLETTHEQLKAEKKIAEDAADRANRIEYARLVDLAHREYLGNNPAVTRLILPMCLPQYRGWEWRFVNRLANSAAVVFAEHKAPIVAAAYSPDGARVATAGSDGRIRVSDAKTGKAVFEFTAPTPAAVAFGPGGKTLATAGFDGVIGVWGADGKPVASVKTGDPRLIALAVSPDGAKIATASRDAPVRVWDVASGKDERKVGDRTSLFAALAFGPDGVTVATVGLNGAVTVWGEADKEPRQLPPAAWAVALALSADGSRLATGGLDGTARVWDTKTGKEVASLHVQRGPGGVPAVALSPDGTRLVTVESVTTARAWDLTAPPEDRVIVSANGVKGCLAVAPGGNRLLVVRGGAVKVLDTTTGAELSTLKAEPKEIASATFSPDGSRVATVPPAGGPVRIWDAATGNEVATHPMTRPVAAVTFGPDGKLVTIRRDGKAEVLDTATGQWESLVGEDEPIVAAALSPDGSRLAVATAGGRVWVRELRGGRPDLLGGRPVGVSVAFSPDGSRLVTGGADGRARVWDLKSGAEVFLRAAAPAPLDMVGFSPDGTRVVAGNRATRVVVWDAAPGK